MWIITHIHTGNKCYLIPEVNRYVVGRVGSDIVLSDDTSISRSHAAFHITDASLKLEDTGSKYGTYYNEQIETKTKLPKARLIDLKEGDRVLFGALKNEWLISKSNITTMVSSLNGPQISEVKRFLNALGGKIAYKWEPSCTHLTMSEITITIKVLHALIEKIPIVSCEYWENYLKDLRDTKQPPKANLYLPKRSAFLSSAIDVENFKFNDKRKTLFAGKTFVFMSKKHYDMYSPIVIKASGQCKDLKSNVPKSYLLQKDVIVVQYVASTQSQGTQTINTISEYLEASSLRTIPEYEIGLAIVCCTTEKYCNPSYNAVSHILPNSADKFPKIGSILVENTRSQKSQFNTLELSVVEVPDSDCLTDKAVAVKPVHSEIYEENQSQLDVVIFEDLKNRDDLECISQIPESNSASENKRKRNESDKNERENHTSKKINLSSQDSFSENLVIPSSSESSKQSQPKNKRKIRTTSIDCDLEFAKKAHISISPNHNIKHFDTDKGSSKGPSNSVENEIPESSAQSLQAGDQKTLNKRPQVNPKVFKKLIPQSRIRHSGFLQKSQITNSQPEVQARNIGGQRENTSISNKRGRIARITDDDSENEDDIFNFGSSPKKSRASGHNSDDELFVFGSNPTVNTVDCAQSHNEEVLPETEPFIPNNRINSKGTFPNIKISPIKVTSEGWLSKINLLKIKSDNDTEVKKENDCENSERNEWIDSIKGGFEVRVRKMNLSSKGRNCSTALSSFNSALNTTKRNYKAFVKKHNYKPQTLIIRTVPIVVPPMH